MKEERVGKAAKKVKPGNTTGMISPPEKGPITAIGAAAGRDPDIAERERAEDALRFTRLSLDNAADTMVCVGQDARFVDVNDAFCRVTGYSREELLSKTVHDIDPDFSAEVWAEFWKKLKRSGSLTFESRHFTKAGKVVPVEVTAKFFEHNGKEYHCAFARDITERKRAEEALRDSEERHRTLFETMMQGVVYQDASGSIISANRAAEGILGLTLDQMQGRTSMDPRWRSIHEDGSVFPGEEHPSMVALRTGKTVSGVIMGVHHPQTNGIRWILIDAVPKFLPGETKPFQAYTTFTDITERKRAEEEIRRTSKELREKNDELNRFIYAVSHDLRSPLVTVQTFQGHLEQDVLSRDAARLEKDLGYIRGAADKMGRLLDELVRLSRVGRIVKPSEEASLQAIVKEALGLVAGRLTARGVRVDLTEEPVVLYGDRTRLVEVFQNLVDNAAKFMGGQPAPRVEIGVEQAGEEFVFHVRDNGIGIEPELQPLVFGLFHKLDRGSEGEGIGLALAKRIVELHGGRIWLESEGLGKGATFRFTLAKTRREPADSLLPGGRLQEEETRRDQEDDQGQGK